MQKDPVVYILAGTNKGTLHIGVTSNLLARVNLHKEDIMPGFTNKFGVHDLVYFELHETMESALERERQLKHWQHDSKIELIEAFNPTWMDLYPTLA